MSFRRAAAALVILLIAHPAQAHRLSPAYFGMTETSAGRFAAEWKVSIPGGLADALEPEIPEGCSVVDAVRSFTVGDARLMHAGLGCDGGLAGKLFTVDGLAGTATDVLLHVQYLDGSSFTHRLVPGAPSVRIPEKPGTLDVITTYIGLGVEHILFGIDHLLFVLALLFLVNGVRRLVATVTAFTLAHSITLGAATLGFVDVPSAPVEATIALSILFLATELARMGAAGAASDSGAQAEHLAARFPWLVAFTFGLLHGFGFAGALREIGLPAGAVPLALLFFNVGVEIGQLMFIAAVLALTGAIARSALPVPTWTRTAVIYVIGSVSALWVLQRSISFI